MEIDEENNENKGGMWDLEQKLDQPMDEEAGRLRNMYREKVTCFFLLIPIPSFSFGTSCFTSLVFFFFFLISF